MTMPVLTQEQAALELIRRRKCRESLAGFVENIKIPLVPESDEFDEQQLATLPAGTSLSSLHRLMCDKLQQTMTTDYGRLILTCPPGAAKSTYGTVVGPSWYMGKFPGSQIILTSYNSDLAKKHGGRGRNIVTQPVFQSAFGTTISKDTTAKDLWSLGNGSEYMSAGLLSGITGNRANGAVIDDPIRGRQDAESPTLRAKTWEAIRDDLMTRLKPRAWVILILTRWHAEDPAGMLLPDDWDGESGLIECKDGMTWEVLNLVAKVETEKQQKYDPLGRKVGQYIWPEWFDERHWKQYEPRPDDPYGPSERSWASLFQGKPIPESGGEWQREWANRYPLGEHPEYLMVLTASDFALTDPDSKGADRDPDWTEHGVAGLDEKGNLWFLDWWYGRGTTDLTIAELLKLGKKWNCRRGFSEAGIIRRAIEPQIRYWQRQLGWRHSMIWLPHTNNKRAKFQSFRSLGAAGKVYIPDCPWGDRLVDELCTFLQRGHDDVGDVCGMFGQGLEDMPWSKQRVRSERKGGVVFGSWEWLTMGTEKERDVGLDILR